MSPSLPVTAADYFGGMLDTYDCLIRRAVPRYDEMTDRLMEYLPPAPMRILDLGCGTGNLTLRLCRQFPAASITVVDASPEMTDVTLRRAAAEGFGPRVSALTDRFEDLSIPREAFDLITSCMALHHVQDKARLYAQIFAWLAPGGTLRFADQLRGMDDAVHSVHWEGWLRFCREPGNCTPEEIESLTQHSSSHDHYTPLAEHFGLLRDAGFRKMDCVWRNYMYAVLLADKAP